MGWSEVVHENRKKAELQRARDELRLRRRGYAVEEKPCANIPAVLSLAGVLTAAAWWRREGRTTQGRNWRNLPGISQLLDFLQSGSKPKRAPATRSKSKPRTQLAPPSKAAAARQAAGGKAGAGPARASSSSSGGGGVNSAAATAAAAAIARSGGGGGGSSGGSVTQQQAAASSSGAQQSKPKKKKNKKKK